jgi:hypothetical protein
MPYEGGEPHRGFPPFRLNGAATLNAIGTPASKPAALRTVNTPPALPQFSA